jgi:hypothetical protein
MDLQQQEQVEADLVGVVLVQQEAAMAAWAPIPVQREHLH